MTKVEDFLIQKNLVAAKSNLTDKLRPELPISQYFYQTALVYFNQLRILSKIFSTFTDN